MLSTTFRTLPPSIRQLKRIIDIPALVTPFGRRKEPVYLNDTTAVPLPFVFQHVHKRIPSAVADGLGKVMILDHVPDGEAFNVDCLVFADKLCACLMEKVLPLIRDLFVLARKSYNSFLSGVRAFLLSGDISLKMFESLFGSSQKLRGINNFGVGSGEKRLYTIVNADLRPGVDWIRYFQFTEDRSIVFPRTGPGDSNGLHETFNRSVQMNSNTIAFRDVKNIIFDTEMLRHSKGLLIMLFLKIGKFGLLVKEIVVGYIQIPECLLQRLCIDFSKPLIFFLLFHLSKCGRIIEVCQSFLVLGVIVNSLSEEIVIHKSHTAKVFGKNLSLAFGRVYSVFESLIDFHTYNYSRKFIECQGIKKNWLQSKPTQFISHPEKLEGSLLVG